MENTTNHRIASDKLSTFWLPEIIDEACSAFNKDEQCEIAVIGAGISGLSTALHCKLRSPDADVVLIEAGRIGYGSSGLSSGQCAPRFGPPIEQQTARSGLNDAAHAWQYSMAACRYLQEFITQRELDVDYLEAEQLQLALGKRNAKRNIDTFAAYSSLNIPLSYYEKKALQTHFPSSPHFHNAIGFPVGLINPGKLCLALKKVALEKGVRIFEYSKADLYKGITEENILINNRHLAYKKLVLATDNNSLCKYMTETHPIEIFVIATSPLTAEQWASIGWPERYALFDNRNYFNFLRRTADNRIIIGGEYHFSSETHSRQAQQAKIKARLLAALYQFFPSLTGLPAETMWSGVSGCTLNGWPVVGFINRRLTQWKIGSWNGHGLALSFLAGKDLAEILVANATPPAVWCHKTSRPLPKLLTRIAIPLYLHALRKTDTFNS
jgi:gamma-glutamylputrescine oxidase